MGKESRNVFDLLEPPESQKPAPVSSQTKKTVFDLPPNEDTWVKPDSPSVSEQLKNVPGLIAREGAADLWALPSNIAEGYRAIGSKFQEWGEKQAASQGREVSEEDKKLTDSIVNSFPDVVKWLGEKFPNLLPTREQAKKKLNTQYEKHYGEKLPEKPRGAIERGAEGVGKALPVLAFPGSALVKGTSIATSAAGEALDLSEGTKLVANLTLPALTSLITAIATRRYIPSDKEALRIMEAGRRFAMTEAELAPILATEGQVGRHGRSAASVQGTRNGFESTGNALGQIVQQVQTQPAARVAVGHQAENALLDSLRDIEHDITSRTHALAPRQQNLVDFIRTTISDIEANGSSPRQLIGTWRNVNAIGAGRTELRRILEPILIAIESVNPDIARDFVDSNLMYSRYVRNLDRINPTAFNHFMDAGELQNVLGAIFTAQPETMGKAALKFMTVKGFQKISSLILTNPTAQSLWRNFGQAVRDGRQGSAIALGIQLKEYVKENLPEEYKEVDWDALGIKD